MNILGSLQISDSVVDFNTSPELNGAAAVCTVEIGGTTFVYVAGRDDAGIQILKMSEAGKLTPVGVFEDTNSVFLSGVGDVNIAQVGSNFYLLATSLYEDGLTALKISQGGKTKGQLTVADSIAVSDGNGDLLDYANDIEVFTTPSGTFAAVTAYYSDAVSIYRVALNGSLALVDSARDTEDAGYRLGGTVGSSYLTIGNTSYLYVGAQDDNGVMIFEVANTGKLSFVDVVDLGSIDLNGLTTGSFNGKNYLVLTDSNNGEFEIYTIGADGIPVFASTFDAYEESGNQIYRNYVVKIVEIDGVDFLISQGYADDSVAIYTIGADDRMEIVQRLSSTELNGANDVTYVMIGGRHFLLAAADQADRVTAIEIGGGDDPIVGTEDDDRMIGLVGDDDLIGRAGNDLIKGGAGDDVLSGRLGNDDLQGGAGVDILIGGAGNDTLEGGAGGDVLLGGTGVDRVSYSLSDAAVTVDLTTGRATGGHADGDYLDSIENLTGSRFADTLTGSVLRDVILGGKGNDTIVGKNGNDVLNGMVGHDVLSGGDGNDRLILGGGNDIGKGGTGRDRLVGGAGRDDLDGGDNSDTLLGGAGNDVLKGGTGLDRLNGGAGADIFVFATLDGSDTIEDFEVNVDRIDFSGHDGFNSFADVVAGSFLFQNTTVIGSGANSIQLLGVRIGQLDADDFIF